MSRRFRKIILLGALSVSTANAQEPCRQAEAPDVSITPVVSIAVLRRNDANGELQWGAVTEACRDFDCDSEPRIAISSCGYDMEPDGFRTLQQEIIAQSPAKYQIVIGPGDSGIMLRAREVLKPVTGDSIPVISPVVIAPGGETDNTSLAPVNSADSTFFTLNVGTERRAEVIVNYLIRKSMRSVAVLYSDTVFGRLSEAALRIRFQNNGFDSYSAYRFADQAEAQRALPAILDSRPVAIGVLGLRSEIYGILDDFQQRNSSWNVYRPMLFTVVDVRGLTTPNLYFPTVSPDPGLDRNDNFSLAYDTMELVIRLVRRNVADGQPFSLSGFREDFLDVLRGPPENPGRMSGMQFNSYLNQAPLHFGVVKKEAGSAGEFSFRFDIQELREPLTFSQNLKNIVDVRIRRFGPKMVINIGIVILIVGYLSILDMQKWYAGTKRSVLLRWPFFVLLAFNLVTALLLYTFLAENRDIRWDQTLEAIVIAFGYAALLKSTVFQTQTGQAIGIGKLYDDSVGWLNDRIMFTKYRRESAIINFVAYRNSLAFLKNQIEGIYRFAKSKERNRELIKQLDDRAKSEASILGKRRVYSEHVLTLMSWKDLQDRQIVPPNLKRSSVINPEILVTLSVNHIVSTHNDNAKTWLLKVVGNLIKQDAAENPNRAKMVRDSLDLALRESKTTEGDIYLLVRWLFQHYSARNRDLEKVGLLPKDYMDQVERTGWRRKLVSFFGRRKSIFHKRQLSSSTVK